MTCSVSDRRTTSAAVLVAAGLVTSFASSAWGTTGAATWAGLISGNWSNALNWSPSTTAPNNGNGGISDYNVLIPLAATEPLLDESVVIDSLTVNSGASLAIGSGNTMTLTTAGLVNSGTLTLLGNGTNGAGTLTLPSLISTSLSGGGTVTLSNSSFSRISGGNLTNVDNTIRGAGIISSNLTNQASLIAEGGVLTLNSVVDNTAGSVMVGANGSLALGSTLTGGTLTAFAGGQITGGVLTNATLTNASVWNLQGGTTSPTLTGTFTNQGALTLLGNGTVGSATLLLNSTGVTTLNGGGTVTLSNSSFSRITNGNLTNVDNTLQGAGIISSNLTNEAAIVAQGGILSLNGTVDNSAGTVSVAANGTLSVGSTLTGGSVSTVTGAQITGGGTLANLTLTDGSIWNVQSGASSPTLSGTFTNHGTLALLGNGTFGSATLILPLNGNLTLNGAGIVILSDSNFSRITNGTLINADNTLRGAGVISSVIINQATVLAENGTLSLNANVDNTAGDVLVSANGTLSVGTTLSGGEILAFPGAVSKGSGTVESATVGGDLIATNGIFSNVTLASASNLTLQSAGTLQLTGTFTNFGVVTILGNATVGSGTLLFPLAATTLTGGGTIVLTDSSFSRVSSGNCINLDNTLEGAGVISSNITNQGLLLAQGGTLSLNGLIDNTLGTVSVAADGILSVGTTLTGGILTTAAGSQVHGGTLANITLSSGSAWSVPGGTSTPALSGTFTNHGTITLLGNGTVGSATLLLAVGGNVTLNGGGTVILSNVSFSRISSGNLTNADNTLRGTGVISATLTNNGALLADGGALTLTGDVTGSGSAAVSPGALLSTGNFTQASLTNNGNFSMTGNGSLGSIQGNGTLSLSGAHLVLPTNSPTVTESTIILTGLNALDIRNNKLVIEPDASAKAAGLSSLQHAVANASLFSSTLPANFGIAVADNAALLHPFILFGGQAADTNTLLVAPELLGDSNLDGHVDLSDLNVVLNHLGTSTPNWTSGNFDGAATIDLTDLNDVLNNLGLLFASPNTSVLSTQSSPLSTSAPEPTSLFLVLTLLPLSLLRRRTAIQSH